MTFVSPWFLLAFLPGVWLLLRGARAIGGPWPGLLLILASLAFYASWDLQALPVLLSSIGLNYLLGRMLEARPSRFLLASGICGNLAVLAYFKYAGFLTANLAALGGPDWGPVAIALPLGFSFITFQKIAYLVDAHRGGTKGIRPGEFLLFVTFFPQLVAGPIVHHHEFVPALRQRLDEAARWGMLAEGLVWFSAGLFKKLWIADSLAPWVAPCFDGTGAIGLHEAWVGALAYSFQLFFDFAGYSEMALGLGLMLGIRLPLNFLAPYQASSIADFWRRWHMTLSRFLRDHLYIPMGGNRHGRLREAAALFLTFLVGGLWHGAGWPFVLWGALHGSYLVLQRLWGWLALPWPSGAWGLVLGRALTFLVVVWAWVPFRAPSLERTWALWRAMLGLEGWQTHGWLVQATGHFPKTMALGVLLLGLWCWLVPPLPERLKAFVPTRAWAWLAAALLLASLGHLGAPTTFLYWQF